MDNKKIKEIGVKKGVKNLKLFVDFLSARFPNESNQITSYFEEWADRFNSGTPEIHMDIQSKKIYEEIKNGI